jgi:hypothetical protein
VERAIVVKPEGNADEFTMTHEVTGNTFIVNDTKGTITGSGTLFEPEWKWTYFKATYQSTNGARIDDDNFMADPNVIAARKRISAAEGKVIGFMDITLKSITPRTFTILASSLLKKKSRSHKENQPRKPRPLLAVRRRRWHRTRPLGETPSQARADAS